MMVGGASNSPADSSTAIDAVGGAGKAVNRIRQPTQHELARSPRSPPGVGLPSWVRWQMTMSDEFASATAARAAPKLTIRPDSAIA